MTRGRTGSAAVSPPVIEDRGGEEGGRCADGEAMGSRVPEEAARAERCGRSGTHGSGTGKLQTREAVGPASVGENKTRRQERWSDYPEQTKSRKAVNLFVCVAIQFLANSTMTSLSVVFTELLQVFGSRRLLTSMIQSLCYGVAYCSSFLAGLAIKRYGLRLCLFVSGSLSAAGFVGAAFVTSIPAIIILVGVVSGVSLSLSLVGACTAATQCFQSKKYYCIMLTSFGSGVGGVISPYLSTYFISHYGWRGYFLMFAGFLLQICPLSLLFRTADCDGLDKEEDDGARNCQVLQIKFFWAILLSTVCSGLSFSMITMMIVDYAKEKGFGISRSTVLLIVYNLISALFRPAFGIIINFLKSHSGMIVYILSSFFAGSAVVVLSFLESYTANLVIIAFIGSQYAGFTIMYSIITLDLVGNEHFPVAYGAMNTAWGLGFACSGPLAGFMADVTRSYSLSFVIVGSITISAAGFLCFVINVRKCVEKKKSRRKEDPCI